MYEGMNAILAGLTATATMSAVMRTAQGLGLLRRPPPATITERALLLRPSTRRPANAIVNAAAHFSYGAALALPFPAIQRRLRLNSGLPLAGMAYGLAIYAANYEGVLPMSGLLPPAHRHDGGWNGSMIAAHLVYGAVLELLVCD
jgi:hypothetical protein